MKKKKYEALFAGEILTAYAFSEREAKILMQAERIKNGYDYEILDIYEVAK